MKQKLLDLFAWMVRIAGICFIAALGGFAGLVVALLFSMVAAQADAGVVLTGIIFGIGAVCVLFAVIHCGFELFDWASKRLRK